jgi:DNA-binding MarR family transcriptional regulator
MDAWRSYVETQSDLQNAIETDLAPTGLTLGDYQVLVFLSEAEEHRMRMCDLADLLQLSPSGLTRRLDGLVRHGWVERVGSDVDRRVMLAVLTDAGFAQLIAAAPTHVDSVRRRLVDLLDDDELDALARVFRKVRAALDS